MSTLLQLRYIRWRTRRRPPPAFVDALGFPYWLYTIGVVAVGWEEWRCTDGFGREVARVKLQMAADDTWLTLADIYVVQRLRGRGIGGALLARLKQFTREQKLDGVRGQLSQLDIEGNPATGEPANPHLPAWYRRHGFTVSPYPEPHDVYVAAIHWSADVPVRSDGRAARAPGEERG